MTKTETLNPVPESRIAYADEWAADARALGLDYNAVRAQLERNANADTPIYLGICNAVVYSDKTDRYSARFDKNVLRVTNEVAKFLLTNRAIPSFGPAPTVNAHMTDGVIDAVLLLFLSRT